MRGALAFAALALIAAPAVQGFLRPQRPLRARAAALRSSRPEPVFEVPLGSSGGRVVVPSADVLRELFADVLGAARSAGLRAGLTRTLQAQRAFLRTAAELASDRELADSLRAGRAPDTAVIARVLRSLFERLGATYVKLGQFVASSPTIFPEAFVLEFQKCLDRTETVPFETVRRIVEAELGGPLSRSFRSVEEVPLASASIAQVHRAVTLDGADVVIKVRKPGVEETLKTDLAFLTSLTKVLEAFLPETRRISLANVAEDLRESMLGELDFRQEAQNLVEFDAFLETAGLTGEACCPLPVRSLTSERVLTMSYLDGLPLLDADAVRGTSKDPEAAVIAALNVWAMSVVAAPFFHADVHGANLLLLRDERVGFIDFGIVGRLPKSIWGAVTALGEAFATRDYEGMARGLVAMGAADDAVDTAAFGRDLEKVLSGLTTIQPTIVVESTPQGDPAATVQVDEGEITRLVLDIVAAADKYGLKLPREFGILVKQALYFDRYISSLAPGIDPLSDPRIALAGRDRLED